MRLYRSLLLAGLGIGLVLFISGVSPAFSAPGIAVTGKSASSIPSTGSITYTVTYTALAADPPSATLVRAVVIFAGANGVIDTSLPTCTVVSCLDPAAVSDDTVFGLAGAPEGTTVTSPGSWTVTFGASIAAWGTPASLPSGSYKIFFDARGVDGTGVATGDFFDVSDPFRVPEFGASVAILSALTFVSIVLLRRLKQ